MTRPEALAELLLLAAVLLVGWLYDGSRGALVSLVAFSLGFLFSRYNERRWPWRF